VSGNIQGIVPQVAVNLEGKTVQIELICSDEYAAAVLFEDVIAKMRSDVGLSLELKANLVAESEASS
jgi:hypothetical protein